MRIDEVFGSRERTPTVRCPNGCVIHDAEADECPSCGAVACRWCAGEGAEPERADEPDTKLLARLKKLVAGIAHSPSLDDTVAEEVRQAKLSLQEAYERAHRIRMAEEADT